MTRSVKNGMLLTSALALGMVPFRAQADQWDKKTIVTIDRPMQVTNTYLEPGTYVFKLANSSSERHIVFIYNREQNHLIDTVIAMPNYQLRPHGHTEFTFWETPAGNARAVRAWFYPGDNFGQEFRYPTKFRQVSTVTTASAAMPVDSSRFITGYKEDQPESLITPQATGQNFAERQTAEHEAVRQDDVRQEEPVLLAQNNPAPTPVPQAEAPESTVSNHDRDANDRSTTTDQLPKTASPYPLLGLLGLLSASAFTAMRMKRLS